MAVLENAVTVQLLLDRLIACNDHHALGKRAAGDRYYRTYQGSMQVYLRLIRLILKLHEGLS